MPWKLLASAETYIFNWLIGYSALLGPIAGIAIIYVLPSIVLAQLIEYRLLVYGLLTLLVVILFLGMLFGLVLFAQYGIVQSLLDYAAVLRREAIGFGVGG